MTDDHGTQYVGVGDKVSGVVGIMVGKITGDKAKVEESRDKRDGTTTTAAGDGDTRDPNHPGIIYTSKGGMKQRNIGGPPPSSSSSPPPPALLSKEMIAPPSSKFQEEEFERERLAWEKKGDHPGIGYTKNGAMKQPNIRPPQSHPSPDSSTTSTSTDEHIDADTSRNTNNHPGISYTKSGAMKQTCIQPPPPAPSAPEGGGQWSARTTATYNCGNNFDVHPHSNYAGPDLTRVIPPPDEEGEKLDLGRIEDHDDLAGRGHTHGHGHDFLHGGFPTGAPSPGLRGRGAEVVDKFDRD